MREIWNRRNRQRDLELSLLREVMKRDCELRLSTEELEQLIDKRGAICSVCKTTPKDSRDLRADVGADREVASLLCPACYLILGIAGLDEEGVDRLLAAARYLMS